MKKGFRMWMSIVANLPVGRIFEMYFRCNWAFLAVTTSVDLFRWERPPLLEDFYKAASQRNIALAVIALTIQSYFDQIACSEFSILINYFCSVLLNIYELNNLYSIL